MSVEFIQLTDEQFLMLKKALPAITRTHLFDKLSISENTWRKIREGRPIKRTTYARMMARYEAGSGSSRRTYEPVREAAL